MKVYTKTGDKGTTALFGGTRVSKSDVRINAYGTVDELNSYIGLLRDQPVNNNKHNLLIEIQDRLFTVGSILATEPDNEKVKVPNLHPEDVEKLEQSMDAMDRQLPEMKSFVLPGGHQSISFCHIARCVCRRAERLVIELSHHGDVDELVIQYLNRLSDYLFVLSRLMAQELKIVETPWVPKM
ncbi:MAG: cob(I)yrinic acid a,c-diamide adenosyltransferase [Bacteroidota bacterium]